MVRTVVQVISVHYSIGIDALEYMATRFAVTYLISAGRPLPHVVFSAVYLLHQLHVCNFFSELRQIHPLKH